MKIFFYALLFYIPLSLALIKIITRVGSFANSSFPLHVDVKSENIEYKNKGAWKTFQNNENNFRNTGLFNPLKKKL